MNGAPLDLRLGMPNQARIYDYWLGGKDHFAADRNLGDKIAEAFPEMPAQALLNRAFLRAAVTHMSANGIRRFLDIGSGLPTAGAVHEIAWGHDPDTKIVYVDNDPLVQVYTQARLTPYRNAKTILGDLRTPQQLLGLPEVRNLLEPGEPVGLLILLIMHRISDDEGAYEMVSELVDALPAGSYFALTQVSPEVDPEKAERLAQLSRDVAEATWRTRAEVAGFFAGLDLIAPGVEFIADWPGVEQPDGDPFADQWIVGGIGRKP